MEFSHFSVMLPECMEGLSIRPDGIYIDGTVGGAGHSRAIAEKLTDGYLYALDQDPDAILTATERLRPYQAATVVQTNFSRMREALLPYGVTGVDGILLDLGVSSHQLDRAERGFSYHQDAPLDMRMSQSGFSAKDLVNTYSIDQLTAVLRDYGEERFAYRIACRIAKEREVKPIETTLELAEVIKSAVPAAARREKNPCKRSFQAIRIAVNGELQALEDGLTEAFEFLNPGGRLVILTFHSLEDRMVKQRFAAWCKGCTCPPDFPVCVCGNKPRAKLVCRKPMTAAKEELAVNHRSHSAKLRILEKL